MSYPVAYRTAAARAVRQRSRPTLIVVTPRQKTPPPSREVRAATMKRITETADMPPLGFSDLWRFLRPLTRLARLHPVIGRVLDIAELAEYLLRNYGTASGNSLNGWVHCWTCNNATSQMLFTRDRGYKTTAGTPGTCALVSICASNNDMVGAGRWDLPWLFRMKENPNTGSVRQMEHWRNPHGVVLPGPGWPQPRPLPTFDPWAPYRWLDPHHWAPIHRPALPEIQPPFYGRPEPVPSDLSERGNTVPRERIGIPEVPAVWPQGIPSIGRRPAPAGTKEKKFRTTAVASGVARALKSGAFVDGKLKDLRDLVNAMNESLPKEFQLKGAAKKRLPDQLMNVWKHLDKMDAKEAFLGILKEIAEDLMGGFGDMLRQKAATKNGWFKTKIFTSPRF